MFIFEKKNHNLFIYICESFFIGNESSLNNFSIVFFFLYLEKMTSIIYYTYHDFRSAINTTGFRLTFVCFATESYVRRTNSACFAKPRIPIS